MVWLLQKITAATVERVFLLLKRGYTKFWQDEGESIISVICSAWLKTLKNCCLFLSLLNLFLLVFACIIAIRDILIVFFQYDIFNLHFRFFFFDFSFLYFQGNAQCKQIPWGNDEELLLAFKEGRTGYPYIDAIMTQLRTEGKAPKTWN